MRHEDPLRYLRPEERAEFDEDKKKRQVIGTAVAATLESLLPQAARAVEKASQGISEAFLFVTENSDHLNNNTQRVIEIMKAALSDKPDLVAELNKILSSSKDCADNIQKACAETIRAMQFQDRNSQIIENAQNMLEIYRQLILSENRSDNPEDHKTQHIAETMYSYIRLSDMRNVFVQELKKRDIDIGQTQLRSFKKNDDTELF